MPLAFRHKPMHRESLRGSCHPPRTYRERYKGAGAPPLESLSHRRRYPSVLPFQPAGRTFFVFRSLHSLPQGNPPRRTVNMKLFISIAIAALGATARAAIADVEGVATLPRDVILAGRQNGANQGRPVPSAACCVAGQSLKQDVCNVNGQSGRCVPDSINNCQSHY